MLWKYISVAGAGAAARSAALIAFSLKYFPAKKGRLMADGRWVFGVFRFTCYIIFSGGGEVLKLCISYANANLMSFNSMLCMRGC